MARRPVILVAPRWVPESMRGEERVAPLEAIADCFVDAILAAGGLPLTMSLTRAFSMLLLISLYMNKKNKSLFKNNFIKFEDHGLKPQRPFAFGFTELKP